MSDGMGSSSERRLMALSQLVGSVEVLDKPKVGKKDKIVLMLIEMCPLAWLFGVDRFYLGCVKTGLAKLTVSIFTASVGGFVWGLLDFFAVVFNGWKQKESINFLGMSAKFEHGQVKVAFILAFVDVLIIPMYILAARFIWLWRKQRRLDLIAQKANKNPLMSKQAISSPSTIRKG